MILLPLPLTSWDYRHEPPALLLSKRPIFTKLRAETVSRSHNGLSDNNMEELLCIH
jgi:hypothetical protein